MSDPVMIGPCGCGGYGQVLRRRDAAIFGRCHLPTERTNDDAVGLIQRWRDERPDGQPMRHHDCSCHLCASLKMWAGEEKR